MNARRSFLRAGGSLMASGAGASLAGCSVGLGLGTGGITLGMGAGGLGVGIGPGGVGVGVGIPIGVFGGEASKANIAGQLQEPRDANGAPVPMQPPVVHAGNRWRYRLVNRFNDRPVGELAVIVQSESPLAGRMVRTPLPPGATSGGNVSSPGEDTEFRFATPWSMLVDPSFDMTMRFEQPVPMLPSVLQVGQTESMQTRYGVDGVSSPMAWNQKLRATAIEQVRTSIGQFDCLRVERAISFQHPDPLRRNSLRNDVVWYAPQVNGIVQREWSGDYVHETSMDMRTMGRRPEDRIRWELIEAAQG